jgi:hypothetical protein
MSDWWRLTLKTCRASRAPIYTSLPLTHILQMKDSIFSGVPTGT